MTMNHFLEDDPIRRAILEHVIHHDTESLQMIVADAASDVVSFADSEMLEDLIWPIFYYSSYCIQRMSAQILGLSEEEEHDLQKLLDLFEERKRARASGVSNWREDGF